MSKKEKTNAADLTFWPHKDYHVWTISLLADALNANQISFNIVDSTKKYRGEGVRRKAKENGFGLVDFDDWIISNPKTSLLVAFTDWGPKVRSVFVCAQKAGIRTASIVEGIQDYYDVDTGRDREAYRTADTVFLPGGFDEKYFKNSAQKTLVLGVPRIHDIRKKYHDMPDRQFKRRALINSNFSYGVLERCRDQWVQDAVDACRIADIEPVISMHPADKGTSYPELVTDKSFYEELDNCGLLISRFASGILESLAMKVPVIYYNGHHERVDKFIEPMGCFNHVTSFRDLIFELQNMESNSAAYMSNAGAFLDLHCGKIDVDPGRVFLSWVQENLEDHRSDVYDAFHAYLNLVYEKSNAFSDYYKLRKNIFAPYGKNAEKLDKKLEEIFGLHTGADRAGTYSINGKTVKSRDSRCIIGPFERMEHRRIDENLIIRDWFKNCAPGYMVDVGAGLGTTCIPFLELKWKVLAFEPDNENRSRLSRRIAENTNPNNLVLSELAVGKDERSQVAIYRSKMAPGISSLSKFHSTHEFNGYVDVVSLGKYLAERNWQRVDYLKADVEGHGLFVLQGNNWDKIQPDIVMCEFDNPKTEPLGYKYEDIAAYLEERDYLVYVSEWHPIVNYGGPHDWRGFFELPHSLYDPQSWGNIIAIKKTSARATAIKESAKRQLEAVELDRSYKRKLALFITEYVKLYWLKLYNEDKVKRAAVFGCGQHTAWISSILASRKGPEICAVLDDRNDIKGTYFGLKPTMASDFDPTGIDAIVLSTDCYQKEMTKRCKELYGDELKLIDLYHGLPSGPYEKEIM